MANPSRQYPFPAAVTSWPHLPTETKFNKFVQEVLEPPCLGLAMPIPWLAPPAWSCSTLSLLGSGGGLSGGAIYKGGGQRPAAPGFCDLVWRLEVRSASSASRHLSRQVGFPKVPLCYAPPWLCLLPLSLSHPLPHSSKSLCQSLDFKRPSLDQQPAPPAPPNPRSTS